MPRSRRCSMPRIVDAVFPVPGSSSSRKWPACAIIAAFCSWYGRGLHPGGYSRVSGSGSDVRRIVSAMIQSCRRGRGSQAESANPFRLKPELDGGGPGGGQDDGSVSQPVLVLVRDRGGGQPLQPGTHLPRLPGVIPGGDQDDRLAVVTQLAEHADHGTLPSWARDGSGRDAVSGNVPAGGSWSALRLLRRGRCLLSGDPGEQRGLLRRRLDRPGLGGILLRCLRRGRCLLGCLHTLLGGVLDLARHIRLIGRQLRVVVGVCPGGAGCGGTDSGAPGACHCPLMCSACCSSWGAGWSACG